MATIAVSGIKPYRCVTRIKTFPEAASQSFIEGAVLITSSTSDKGNEVKEASADPVTKIVGIAGIAASGTEGTDIPVYAAVGENEFIANIESGATLDNDMVGVNYGLVKSTYWRVDTSDTTNVNVKVVALVDAHGDTNGRVVFRFLDKVSALSGYAA
jgi:hypothetical protein